MRLAELEALPHKIYGQVMRVRCPIHGGDRQLSMKVNLETGYYKCYNCGVWGYLEDSQFRNPAGQKGFHREITTVSSPSGQVASATQRSETIGEMLRKFQKNLVNSPGCTYLEKRGIPLEVGIEYELGYAPPGTWPQKGDNWGRLVFPLFDSQGLVNLYGRAIHPHYPTEDAPKEGRHRFLAGSKGYFNRQVLNHYDTVIITEGVFDCLSLIVAGYLNSLAICGSKDFRAEWFVKQREIILAVDVDTPGKEAAENIGVQACACGFEVSRISRFGGYKDLNEMWVSTKNIDLTFAKTAEHESILVEVLRKQREAMGREGYLCVSNWVGHLGAFAVFKPS